MQVSYRTISVANGDEKFMMVVQAGGFAADVLATGEKVIYELAGYRQHLPAHVSEFAICHEAAHLDLNHLAGLDPDALYDLPDLELEADARAVSFYGCEKHALDSMLVELPVALTAALREHGVSLDPCVLQEAVVQMRIAHGARLAALAA